MGTATNTVPIWNPASPTPQGAGTTLERSSKPVAFGNNGYYAVGKGADSKFYRANGIEITAAEFRIKCPSIHDNVTRT